ncbi:response regulator [Neobacillus mesonae]|nr:response regulator [Neobacillus mesonae]
MCKVLLVDDEKIARVGLRTVFDWKGHGYEVVGEAANGAKAMKWVESRDIDILITDIAMPVMDGLELTRAARELCPWVQVLLLSCHSDFKYVREGIRLGASDYILKPTLTESTLVPVLDHLRQKMHQEKQNLRILNEYKREAVLKPYIKKEQLLCKALSDDDQSSTALYREMSAGSFRVAVLDIDQSHISLELIKKRWYDEFPDTVFSTAGPNRCAIYLRKDAATLLLLEGWIDREHDSLNFSTSELSLTLGLSSLHEASHRIRYAFEEAKTALAAKFFTGPGRVLSTETMETYYPAEPVDNQESILQFTDMLRSGLYSKGEEILNNICKYWIKSKSKDQVITEAEELLSLFVQQGAKQEIVSHIRQLDRLKQVQEVIDIVKQDYRYLTAALSTALSPEESLHERIIGQAVSYMHTHFRKSISLQEVANHVSVSRNYFSEMFKRVTGHTFIDYLIHLRLGYAKDLLGSSSFKVYEVAERSGFNDVKHFSKQFKKWVGMSPAEFQGLYRK